MVLFLSNSDLILIFILWLMLISINIYVEYDKHLDKYYAKLKIWYKEITKGVN